jgi:hypothetical protein
MTDHQLTNSYILAAFLEEIHCKKHQRDVFWHLKEMNIDSHTSFLPKNDRDRLRFMIAYGWIMPVVDTIHSLEEGHDIVIAKGFVKLTINTGQDKRIEIETGDDALFNICASFVKWYTFNTKRTITI